MPVSVNALANSFDSGGGSGEDEYQNFDWLNPEYNVLGGGGRHWSLDDMFNAYGPGGYSTNRPTPEMIEAGMVPDGYGTAESTYNDLSFLQGKNPEAWSVLNDLSGNPDSYRQRLDDYFGSGGIQEYTAQNGGDQQLRQNAYVGSNNRLLDQYNWFNGEDSWFEDAMNVIIPAIVAVGGGAVGGAVAGAAGAGPTATAATQGAVSGGLNSTFSGQNPLTGAVLGGLGAGAGQYVSSGANSFLGDYSGGDYDFLTRRDAQQLAQAAGRAGTTLVNSAVTGKNPTQSLLGLGLNTAGGLAFPDGISLSNMFGGNNMPYDDGFDMSGGMSYGGPNVPQGLEGFYSQPQGPMSTNQNWMDQTSGSSPGLNDVFQNMDVQNPGQQRTDWSQVGGTGLKMPAMSKIGGPANMSNAPTSATGNEDEFSQFKKFMGGDVGKGVMRLLAGANPSHASLINAMLGGGQKMGPLESILGAAGTVYNNRQNNRNMQQVRNGLQDMFSPNSAYAQQLRQTLDRKDAASGRRSQYGPREVELQARLAEMNSRNAPTLMNANQQINSNNNQLLRDLLIYGQRSGGFDALGDLFNNMQTPFGPGTIGNLD